MFKILAINFNQKRFNCSNDQQLDSIGEKSTMQVKKSSLDFFGQNCVPQVKFGLWLNFDQDNSRDSSKIKNFEKLPNWEIRVSKESYYFRRVHK